jgi:hypothetical protein
MPSLRWRRIAPVQCCGRWSHPGRDLPKLTGGRTAGHPVDNHSGAVHRPVQTCVFTLPQALELAFCPLAVVNGETTEQARTRRVGHLCTACSGRTWIFRGCPPWSDSLPIWRTPLRAQLKAPGGCGSAGRARVSAGGTGIRAGRFRGTRSGDHRSALRARCRNARVSSGVLALMTRRPQASPYGSDSEALCRNIALSICSR